VPTRDTHLRGAKGWVVVFALELVVVDLLGPGVDCVGHSIRYLAVLGVYLTGVRGCVVASLVRCRCFKGSVHVIVGSSAVCKMPLLNFDGGVCVAGVDVGFPQGCVDASLLSICTSPESSGMPC